MGAEMDSKKAAAGRKAGSRFFWLSFILFLCEEDGIGGTVF